MSHLKTRLRFLLNIITATESSNGMVVDSKDFDCFEEEMKRSNRTDATEIEAEYVERILYIPKEYNNGVILVEDIRTVPHIKDSDKKFTGTLISKSSCLAFYDNGQIKFKSDITDDIPLIFTGHVMVQHPEYTSTTCYISIRDGIIYSNRDGIIE